MEEAQLPLLDRLVEHQAINPHQRAYLAQAEATRSRLRDKLRTAPPTSWKNLGELDQIVTANLAQGRASAAAEILEAAYPPEKAPWDVVDRAATLRLHLGEPEKARELWRRATQVPEPSVRDARLAAATLAEGQFDLARQAYEQALKTDPAALRGAIWPGDPRARRGPGLGRLRARPGRDRIGTERRGAAPRLVPSPPRSAGSPATEASEIVK